MTKYANLLPIQAKCKTCASHAGLTLGEDGATHQVLEDIGMMKMFPGMVVINPCDYNQTKAANNSCDSKTLWTCISSFWAS